MKKNTKIGVALAGGGLQGFSHIGAIRALEELGIDISYISGTSTGSLMASLYAMGFTTYEIESILKNDYKKILKFSKRKILKLISNYLRFKETRVEGIIDGKIIEDLIDSQAKIKNIDNISNIKNKKLAIATVDTKSMKECIFVSNKLNRKDENIDYIENINVGKAVRASMAFPAIFTTTSYQNYNFIDGGTTDNLPVQVLKDMGAEKVIAIGFDLSKYEPAHNLEGVIIRALDIFSSKDVRNAQKIADVSVEIYNANTSLLKMDEVELTIKNGYDTVMQKKEEIKKILNF